MPRLLALPPIDDDDCSEPTVFCGPAPFRQKEVQNAGRAFFDRFELDESSPSKSEADKHDGSGSDDDQASSPTGQKKKKEKKERDEALKLPECLKGEDLYALLEVDSGASQDDMKKAWRKICLTHHPDKHADKSPEDMEAVNDNFVKLQEAFNVLSDQKKRRKYDSMGDFDDRVPTKLKDGEDFFEVFSPVFKRNAKWSERRPVPDLGDAETKYEKVKAFYEFWYEFESWRDMDALIMEEEGEDCFQDLEEAECREERRWMERENARIRGKYLKQERQRIFGFVEAAEKYDPRVKAEKDRQHAAREAAKAAKDAKRLEAERLVREEEERRRKEEERERIRERVEKAKREEAAKARKAARATLRKMVKDLNIGLVEDSLQEFLLALGPEETDALTQRLRDGAQKEAILDEMKSKGIETKFAKTAEDEKSTEEGSPSEEEDPAEVARLEKERLEKQKIREARQKKENAVLEAQRKEDQAKRDEEKAAREVKKKAEQEKKDREQEKANKKEKERLKREEEKKIRDEEKLVEKARLEKEANAKRAEEQRQRQKAENEAELNEKQLEVRTMEFERDRLARCDAFDKLSKEQVAEAAQAAVDDPIVASGLSAASGLHEDPEDLLDAQLACLGSFFALGKRPEEDQLALSPGLRNRVKKLRTRLRTAAAAGEFVLAPAVAAAADNDNLELLLAAARGEGPPPGAAEKEAEAPPEELTGKAAKKAKAKAKAAAPKDEDLDALLQEFGMDSEKKSKKSGKKK